MRILIVEDESLFAQAVAKRLSSAGHDCAIAGSLGHAIAHLMGGEKRPDLLLLDERLPDGSGLELLNGGGASSSGAAPPAIIMTAYGEVEQAVTAMKRGAVDYLEKPVDLDQLERAVARAEGQVGDGAFAAAPPDAASDDPFVGDSPALAKVRAQIQAMASIQTSGDAAAPTILIQGETGTGKYLAARRIHDLGDHSAGPFVQVDCAALPKDLIEAELFGSERGAFTGAAGRRTGLVEEAAGGTLFLDEIGELSPELQAKLLALLDRRRLRRLGSNREIPVRARFIAATNRDLEAMVAEGGFRADLFFRLKVMRIFMPALRDSLSDVPKLAEHHARRTAETYGRAKVAFTREALERLASHDWPGNVRELHHCIEKAVLLNRGAPITADELDLFPADAAPPAEEKLEIGGADVGLDEAEKLVIESALRRAGGNVSRAARLLNTTRMTLRYRIAKHGIKLERD